MRAVGVRDLKLRTSEIVRLVREGHEPVDVTYRGRVVARIVPIDDHVTNDAWADLDALGSEIAASWLPGVDAVDAVRDVRREL